MKINLTGSAFFGLSASAFHNFGSFARCSTVYPYHRNQFTWYLTLPEGSVSLSSTFSTLISCAQAPVSEYFGGRQRGEGGVWGKNFRDLPGNLSLRKALCRANPKLKLPNSPTFI
jgi:hypothetical protein